MKTEVRTCLIKLRVTAAAISLYEFYPWAIASVVIARLHMAAFQRQRAGRAVITIFKSKVEQSCPRARY
jgi:hypothetical protein